MRKLSLMILVVALFSVYATSVSADGESELLGLGFGAVTGAVIGNQFGHGAGRVATTTAGVFAGGYIGGTLGRELDRPNIYSGSGSVSYAVPSAFDYQAYAAPNYVAPDAPDPAAIYMNNAATGVCREFAQGGNYGVACLQPDGSWRVVH